MFIFILILVVNPLHNVYTSNAINIDFRFYVFAHLSEHVHFRFH